MKKIAIVAALAVFAASTAYAGSLADPVIDPVVVIDDATGSSSGILLPLILLVLVAAAVASN